MYSLTNATELFIEKYVEGTEINSSDLVKRYNAHKVRHSVWVLECGRMILLYMKQNGFYNKKLFNQAEITFLLHDIARMFQNNWSDILSVGDFDHWYEGYKILKEIWEYDNLICLAIKYHDKYDITELFNEKEYLELIETDKKDAIFLANIIRDADKIQNMIYSIYNPEDLFFRLWGKFSVWPVSKENLDKLNEQVNLWRKCVETRIDWVLNFLTWLFDINFPESYKLLKSFNYYEEMIKILESMEWCDEDLINSCEKYIWEFYRKK